MAKLPVPTSEPVDDAASSGESGKFCSSSTLSTHSPQVLGHLEPENIWVLRRDDKGEVEAVHPQMTYGMDSNRVLEQVMDGSERKPEIKADLQNLFRLLDGDLQQAKVELQALSAKLEKYGNHPDLVRARAIMSRLEMLGE